MMHPEVANEIHSYYRLDLVNRLSLPWLINLRKFQTNWIANC